LRTGAHRTGHLNHKFTAEFFGLCKKGFWFGIEHHLDEAGHIAKIDKKHAAVITPGMNPSG
jgi:high-affinity nickel permease